MANKVIHKRSIQKGLLPSGTTLDYGEIAVNYNSGEPFLSIRTTESGKTETNYAKFIDEATIDAKIKNVENQNAFSKVAVSGKSTIEADSATDTLTFAAGSNISITTDASNDKITIAATGLSASGHTHDDRYYTESEINALLNKKSDTGHTHTQYSETGHTHDDVYKPVQTAVTDPTASGSSTTFIATISQDEDGVITATKKTVNFSNYKPVQTAVTDPTASGSSTTFIASISQDKNGVVTATKQTVKLANALTFGTKSYDGSSAQTITAADLGLGAALKYCGITTTALTDGATTNPIKINNTNHTATAGCVVFYGDKEFVFNGTNWELLGAEATYKVVQTAVSDPTASTATTTTFISNIEQDKNGVIAATKKTLPTATSGATGIGIAKLVKGDLNGKAYADGEAAAAAHTHGQYAGTGHTHNGVYKPIQAVVSDPSASGNSTTFISTISQDKNGVIAATKKTVPIAKFDTLGLVKPSKSYTGAATLTTAAASTTTAPTINAITTTAGKYYAVEVDKNGVPFVNVPWSDTNTDTHYTTHMYLGSSTATADATSDVANPYIRLFDNTTAREDIQVVGQNNLTVKGKNGIITIDGSHNHDGTYLKSYTETYQGTLTGITVTGASGLTGTGTISKTSGKTGGTITLGHATKTVSTTTPTGTTNLSHEGTFVIPTIGYDSYGHVSGITNTTYKLPSDNNTWRPVYNGVDSTSTESGATANAVKTAYDLAKSKWTYSADTIKAVKVNSAAAADKVSSAITLTYGSTAGKTGSTIYSGNTSPTVYIPTSTSHITNDSGYITSAHTHAASAITGGTNGYFLKADSNGKGVWTSVTIPSAYSLPTASSSVKGGVKVGNFLAMSGETLYVKTGITSSTVAVGNHTHSTYATKDEIAAINQTIEEHELVTAEALVNLNDRITNIVNTDSTSEKAYLTGLAESGEGEIVMNNDVYMAGGNIYVQDGKIVATQEYLDENLETLAAAAVDLNNRLNNGAPVKVEKNENVRAELGGFVVRNWNNEVPEIHTSHYVSSGVYMEQNSVYTVNGFYQTSDERKKNFENEIEVDFNKLKEIPKSYFTWKDDEKQVRNIGTSAQKLAEIYPELVSYNETDDEYSVSYAELSIVALKAVDKLYEENQMLREELAMIKKHLGL